MKESLKENIHLSASICSLVAFLILILEKTDFPLSFGTVMGYLAYSIFCILLLLSIVYYFQTAYRELQKKYTLLRLGAVLTGTLVLLYLYTYLFMAGFVLVELMRELIGLSFY